MFNESGKWLLKAEKDLSAAKINLQNDLFEEASFFSHQSAEKALKSIYIERYQRLWKVHDLTELGRKVGAPEEIIEKCDSLNPHYIASRYPLDVEYTKEDADTAVANAEEVISWARKESVKK